MALNSSTDDDFRQVIVPRQYSLFTQELINMFEAKALIKNDAQRPFLSAQSTADSQGPANEALNAEQYLTMMVNQCPLDEIYKIVMIGYKDQGKTVCPVLVRINQEKLREYYEGKYLLQCWDGNGKLVYQRALKFPHLAWAVSAKQNTFMYVLDPRDEADSCFHIVQLNNCSSLADTNKVEVKIRDWTGLCGKLKSPIDKQSLVTENDIAEMFLGLTDEQIFVVATRKELFAVDAAALIEQAQQLKNKAKFTIQEGQNATLKQILSKELWSLWENSASGKIVGAFGSNQQAVLDFYEVGFLKAKGGKISVNFQQIYELSERQIKIPESDQIDFVKIVTINHQGSFINVCVVLRVSQNIDFYWNGKLVFASEETPNDSLDQIIYSDIHLSFDQIYLRKRTMRDKVQTSQTDIKISLSQAETISTLKAEIAKPIETSTLRFFQSMMVHDHYKPFQQFVSYENYLCVCHGNTVSIFNTLTGIWEKHFSFGYGDQNLLDTQSTFDFQRTNYVVCIFLNSNNGEICVYFQDGTFIAIYFDQKKGWRQRGIKSKTEGTILSFARDKEHTNALLIITRDEQTNECSLYTFHLRVAAKVDLEGKFQLKSSTKIISFFSPADNTQFLLINVEEGHIGILELAFEKIDDRLKIQCTVQLVRNPELKSFISSKIHSAVSTDLASNLVLFDQTAMHVINMKTYNKGTFYVKEITTHPNMLIKGVHLFDNHFMYVLYDKQLSSTTTAMESNGFGLVDLACFNTDISVTPLILPVCDAIGGINDEFVFSPTDQRITFIKDYDKFLRVPLLHLNTVVFQGIQKKTEYFGFRIIGGSFIALSNDGRLQSWDLMTGLRKVHGYGDTRQSYVATSLSLEGYQTWQTPSLEARKEDDFFRDGHFDTILVYRTQPEEDTAALASEFYSRRSSMNDCLGKSYCESLQQTFHQCKLIRIISETKVQEVSSFTHVRLANHEQHLFFSHDNQKMLEIDNGEFRLFKYIEGKKFMQMIAKLPKMPWHLVNNSCMSAYGLFSPNFDFHLDFELLSQEFVVRQVPSGAIQYRLPRSFLDTPCNTKAVSEQLKFISWVDNQTLRLIDIGHSEPYEKLVQLNALSSKALVEELASSTMPFFDKQPYLISQKDAPASQQKNGVHFFIEPMALDVNDVQERLKRKHQNLKRVQYIVKQSISNSAKSVVTYDSRRFNLTKALFHVDYKQPQPVLDLPFTLYYWRLIEYYSDEFARIASSEGGDRESMEKKFQQPWALGMALSILPDIKTLFHFAANDIAFLQFLRQMLQGIEGNGKAVELPFIQDFNQKTPLHLNFDGQIEKIECASLFLDLLKNMPLDHHGKAIANIIYKCLDYRVPGIQQYLSARLLPTSQFQSHSRNKDSNLKEVTEEEPDFVTSLEPQPDQAKLFSTLFDPGEREAYVKIRLFDIPYVHCPDREEAQNFCNSLQSSFDETLFQEPCVTSIIQYRWNVTNQAIKVRLFLPYIVYAVSFGVYLLTKKTDQQGNEGNIFAKHISLALLLLLSLYFLYLEKIQFNVSVMEHFKSFWNVFDVIPPLLIITTAVLGEFLYTRGSEPDLYIDFRNTSWAVIALMLCLKLFYFLRIFRNTGYFISMLVFVVMDARWFFMLYFLIHVAFFFSFAILTEGQYTLFDVFLMSNGQYTLDGWDLLHSPTTMALFFVLAIFTINIVMLNILIAIVSTAYDRVVSTQRQFSDFERLCLIMDNRIFVNEAKAKRLSKPNEYLIVAQNVTS